MADCARIGGLSSSSFTDHYATLGLDRRCTLAQIRAAYRVLVRQCHPDVNGATAETIARTQDLNAAYEILSDPAKRRAYDEELEQDSHEEQSTVSERIEVNISQDVMLRIDELIRGTTLTIRVNDPANHGGPEQYDLVVPEETAPGVRFRVARHEPFANGFVIVRVKVRPDARFKARGSDLRCDLRIQAARAASGGTEYVTGPMGRRHAVAIPRGVKRGAIIRVPREGLPKSRGGRGDLLVRITYKPEVSIGRKSQW